MATEWILEADETAGLAWHPQLAGRHGLMVTGLPNNATLKLQCRRNSAEGWTDADTTGGTDGTWPSDGWGVVHLASDLEWRVLASAAGGKVSIHHAEELQEGTPLQRIIVPV